MMGFGTPMGPGDRFQMPSFSVSGKINCSQEKYEIAMGQRCHKCKKLFKLPEAKRRKPTDCKCPPEIEA